MTLLCITLVIIMVAINHVIADECYTKTDGSDYAYLIHCLPWAAIMTNGIALVALLIVVQ